MTFVAHLFYYGSQVVEDNVVMIECSLCLIKTNLIVLIFKKLTCSTKRFFLFLISVTTCKPLEISFPNGNFHGKGSMLGDRYKFKCNSPYLLVGNDEVVCGKDGLWSGEVPFCQRRKLRKMLMMLLTDIF